MGYYVFLDTPNDEVEIFASLAAAKSYANKQWFDPFLGENPFWTEYEKWEEYPSHWHREYQNSWHKECQDIYLKDLKG